MAKKGRFNIPSANDVKAIGVAVSAAPERKMGRPAGKRTDPAFRQVSAWLRKDTYGQVRARLFEGGDGKEFSELVQDLLEKWLHDKELKV